MNIKTSSAILLCLTIAACQDATSTQPVELSLSVISSAPHLVTGGDALIEIRFRQTDFRVPELRLNGAESGTDLFNRSRAIEGDGVWVVKSLVTGLIDGENTLTAALNGSEASITLVNYPRTGPVISGEQQTPYVCLHDLAPDRQGNARRFAIGNGEFLDSRDQASDCSLPTRIDYVYRALDSEGFIAIEDPTQLPDNIASITHATGQQVPFVVKLETGTINRAIYQIAMLFDPHAQSGISAGWNGRLVYSYGGGCEAGYFQGTTTGGVLRESTLAAGYAVASSTLNVNAQGGCNDVVSAETTMMVKEHFVENYGLPVHTIGTGGSGGAMQQLLIAGAYPGILDGLLISMTFPDAVTYFTDSQECSGPWRQFANDPANGLNEATRALIGGWPNWSLCDQSLGSRPDRISPFDCSAEIPAMLHYHPQNNPGGW